MKQFIITVISIVVISIVFAVWIVNIEYQQERERMRTILIGERESIYKYDKETKKYNLVWKDTGEKVE